MDFIKYYFLEDYLFKEVRNNFQKRGYLTAEEFFCIVIWKSNRAKTKIKKKLLGFGDLTAQIKKMTSEIFNEADNRKKLKILFKEWRFSLPMATAILTVLYPDDFTIYDVRVRGQLKMKEIYGVKPYFEKFLPLVKERGNGKSLREKDQCFWGKSFYEDLRKFLKVE